MWFGVSSRASEPVNASVLSGFDDLVNYHSVNSVLGCVCSAVNVLLLVVFLSTPKFRTRYVLLIQLCIGDTINSIAIILTGLNRIDLYSTAVRTRSLPIRTSAECAAEIWLLLKLVGDLLIPISTLWMGIERFTAIRYPLLYRTKFDGTSVKYIILPSLSALFVVLPMSFAMFQVDDHITSFHCGRKAAFGESFGTFIYIYNIVCNVVSTILNAAAFVLATRLASTMPQMQRQVGIIRYYLFISVLSTLLVSLPNAIALFQLYVQKVSDSVSKPAYWMQTINSGIHFFVYLCLNREFRGRTKIMLSSRQTTKKEHSPLAEDRGESPLNPRVAAL